jgi:hypothetical protein
MGTVLPWTRESNLAHELEPARFDRSTQVEAPRPSSVEKAAVNGEVDGELREGDPNAAPLASLAGGHRGCMAAMAIAGVVCLSAIVPAYFVLRTAIPGDPGVDVDRVARLLATEEPAMEAHARLVLQTADAPSTRCAPQAGGPPPSTPLVPIAGGVRVWCTKEIDPTTLWRWVVDVDGVDPAGRCAAGAIFVVFDVPEATWGTPFVVFSEHCAPTSWYDGDPSYGRSFVPVHGPWYAVQPTGAALPHAW